VWSGVDATLLLHLVWTGALVAELDHPLGAATPVGAGGTR
jgi:hypothetical protein